MPGFKVVYDYDGCLIASPVYAIDTTQSRFLIADDHGYFMWARTVHCRLLKEEEL